MERQEIHPSASRALLTPDDCALVLVDYQSQMFFGVESIDRQTLTNNVIGLAKAAKAFDVPTIVTTINEKGFSGPMPVPLQELSPDGWIDRTTMNPWEDENLVAAVTATGRPKIVWAGLWTEVCIVMPVLSSLETGYEVYAVVDACGGTSAMAHDTAVQHMVQAGVVPLTWLRFMLELQRDWAREETAGAVAGIAIEHAGAYGQGMQYYNALNPRVA